MEEYFKLFNDYVKKFDCKDEMIIRKYHHTYRVMNFCEQIALSIHEDTKVAKLCGLFHDIGRFEQCKKYHSFSDIHTVDHGDLGFSILQEHFSQIENYDLVLFTTKNHNKLFIEETNDSKKILFAKIVRDADKLDIMNRQGLAIDDKNPIIKEELMMDLFLEQPICNQLITYDVDNLFRILGFIYDINFKFSYQYILDNCIIEKKIDLLESHIKDIRLEKLKEHLLDYCKNKINE